MAPPTVRLRERTVRILDALRVTAPLPKFRSPEVPANAKSPFQFCVLLFVSVLVLPLVLSIVPPVIVNVPLPTAVLLLIAKVPALSVAPPL